MMVDDVQNIGSLDLQLDRENSKNEEKAPEPVDPKTEEELQ